MSNHKEKLQEFRDFATNDLDNMAAMEITDIGKDKLTINIGDMFDFDVTFSPELSFSCEEEGMEELVESINNYVKEHPKDSIRVMMKVFTDLWLQEMEDESEGEGEDDEFVGEFASPIDAALLEKDPFQFETPDDIPKSKKSSEREDMETLKSQFDLKDANPVAVSRLLKDYYELQKAKNLGFHAYPKGKNLFEWEVRLTKFDIKTDLIAKDLQQYNQQKGQDYILLSLKFPAEYPFKPPFIRVIRPRMKYLTGHVTIGGSICMQILTSSGWMASASIESVMVQILLAMSQGGARIDFNKMQDYTEFEAKDAFFRVAKRYGWEK